MSEHPPDPATRPASGNVAVDDPVRTRPSCAAGGEPINGYRLHHRLGRGGFGEVGRAEGPGGIPVALKFIFLGGKAAGWTGPSPT